MNRITFGKTGLSVSRLGYGAAEVGFLKKDRDDVERILTFLLDSGVNVIDTAASYEGSEQLIGDTISSRRKDFVLISKCGQQFPEIGAPAWSSRTVLATVDRALSRLRTDHLDVMLLHSCELPTLQKGEALGALVEAQKQGKVRHVGYSGDNEAAAWAAGRPEIAVIETSISLADQANIDAVLPIARQNSIGILAKRPIANAAWRQPSQQPGFYGSYAEPYHQRLKKMGLQPADVGFPANSPEAWAELALRFTLSQEGVHTAIIGTTRVDNARKNIAAAERGPLPADAIAKIREAFRKAESAAGEKWTGET